MSPRLVGAGVLCVSRDSSGDVVLLLGKEKEVSNWKYGSSKWCCFSGRAEAGETAISTAAREFLEESCGMVRLHGASQLPSSWEECCAVLERSPSLQNFLKSFRRDAADGLQHVTFLCVVPFEEPLPRRFHYVRHALSTLDELCKTYQRCKKACEHLPRSFMPGVSLTDDVVTVMLEHCIDEGPAGGETSVAVVQAVDARTDYTFRWAFQLSREAAREAKELSGAWIDILDFLQMHACLLRHPALNVIYRLGFVVSASVNRSFLEKTELAWFKLRDLADPDFPGETFKSHFLELVRCSAVLLQRLLDEEESPATDPATCQIDLARPRVVAGSLDCRQSCRAREAVVVSPPPPPALP